MMKERHLGRAISAGLAAMILLGMQIWGGWEYTAGEPLQQRATMIVAIVSVALLPIAIHWAMSIRGIGGWLLAIVMFIGFTSWLAYSLPASVGRVSEKGEVKELSAADAARIRDEIAALDRTLGFARPDRDKECNGAPEPPKGDRWAECRRKRTSVTSFEGNRAYLVGQLSKIDRKDQVGDVQSRVIAWALSRWEISAGTVRNAQGLVLPIALEVTIFALVWYASIEATGQRQTRSRPTPGSWREDWRRMGIKPPPAPSEKSAATRKKGLFFSRRKAEEGDATMTTNNPETTNMNATVDTIEFDVPALSITQLTSLAGTLEGKPIARPSGKPAACRRLERAIFDNLGQASAEKLRNNLATCTSMDEAEAMVKAALDPKAQSKAAKAAVPTKAELKEKAKAAKAPAKKAEAEDEEADEGEEARRGRRSQYSGKTIFANCDENPRREGSHGHRSMAIVIAAGKKGIKYEDYVEKGGRIKDLLWDVQYENVIIKG